MKLFKGMKYQIKGTLYQFIEITLNKLCNEDRELTIIWLKNNHVQNNQLFPKHLKSLTKEY